MTTTSATPTKVTFVPGDQESGRTRSFGATLTEGHATVLVSEDAELPAHPQPRSRSDRLRGRRVEGKGALYIAPTEHASPCHAITGRLGRHPVRQMRELAHA